MKLIVGLGNPGKKYEKTRHNVGFMILDSLHKELSKNYDINPWSINKKFNAQTAGTSVKGEKVILAKPLTFMNATGHSVALIANYYKISAEDIIVVHDDKDIDLGILKIQTDRGHAGHNGIRSIIEQISSTNFERYRVGIASRNEKRMKNTSKFVLGKFGVLEKRILNKIIAESVHKLQQNLESISF